MTNSKQQTIERIYREVLKDYKAGFLSILQFAKYETSLGLAFNLASHD